MIAKVTRGDGPGEAVRYLFSAGRHNEHEDPHVVAAAAALGVSGGLRPSLAELEGLEAAMEAPSVLYGTEVAGGTCWHLALSTKGEVDRDLSDEEWAEIARETVRQLGFDAGGAQSPCRWVAVRHGRSEAGNDHMHLVVNLVREDGKVASTRNDFKRLSALCTDMERRYGLSAVEGRANKTAIPGLTRAETEKARRTGRDETERAELARVVRAAATVAGSEAEFVRFLRDAGLAARPRYDRVGGHRVVGYAVAEEPSDGGVAVFFGGGKLARDLSLPALRDRWRDGEAESQDAAAEWAGEAPATGVHEAPRASRHLTYRWAEASERWGKTAPREEHQASAQRSPAGWRKAPEGLGEVVRRLGAVPAEDVSHLASSRLRRGGGAGCLIGAIGALPRAARPRLGPAGPLGPRAPARASQARLCPSRHHQVGGRPHGPSGPRRGHARRLEASLRRDSPGGPGGPRCPLGALGIRAGWPPRRRGTEGPGEGKGPPRLAGSAPGRAPRGGRGCARGGGTGRGGGCEAAAPPGGQRCAAARAVRRDDAEGGPAEAVLGRGEVSVAEAVLGRTLRASPLAYLVVAAWR